MSWPGGAAYAVSVTVDVDGTFGLPRGGDGSEARLTSRSERSYGVLRGVPRILAILAGARVTGTFYVPGAVAAEHPETVGAIAAGGHEVGHHGHRHRRPDELSDAEQRHELAAGLEALTSIVGKRPTGYRAPEWEMAPYTLDALAGLGFSHDSSLMSDDDVCRVPSGSGSVIELPVHWSLDDAPHFDRGGDPATLSAMWHAELDMARAEGRHVTFTMHPEILGRPHRACILERLVERALGDGAWIAPHREVAAHVGAS
ncbi:MAG TPA: polysaccharide deacetylase family protein [Solirubrobacteraceae bacterium]|nr:polysaccharide deacetylase family protein [Solirubrobacteraceae bacterium]